VEAAAHTDERRRLAGLLSHGLDSLADVLRRSVASGGSPPELSQWLAEYLQRRIHVIAWLLDHWNQPPPAHDSVIDAAQAHETLNSLERVFAEVRLDSDLRSRLGWANGPLSDSGDGPPFVASVDWPAEFETTLPVRGGLGFFLTEVLSNAMRHGAARSTPRVAIRCDRVKKELAFEVDNDRRDDRAPSQSKYGGLALLAGMARLFLWRDFAAARSAGKAGLIAQPTHDFDVRERDSRPVTEQRPQQLKIFGAFCGVSARRTGPGVCCNRTSTVISLV
jgi:hypothetical protein